MADKRRDSNPSNTEVRSNSSSADDDRLVVEGIVVDKLPNNIFKVALEKNNYVVLAHLSGKIRMNNISIIPGDKVKVELTPYDLNRGRIVFRVK